MNTNSLVKNISKAQLKKKANSSLGLKVPTKPKEGWIRTIRKALGMSCSQVGALSGSTRNKISILERKEISGDITLNQLNTLAKTMNCKFVYAVIPEKDVDSILYDRAEKIAQQIMNTASQNMFLEGQSIPDKTQETQVTTLANEIKSKGGRALWKTRIEK